jgi:predicted alpha/beta-fold hydrolase
MCSYLVKKGKDTGLVGSVAVCPPWDVFKGTHLLETRWPNTLINRQVTRFLHDLYDR